MKTRTIKEIEGTERDVEFKEGRSLRVLLEKDNMGFSLHKTLIRKNEIGHWHYKNHQEACFCVSGYGKLTNLTTGQVFEIKPDTTYILDEYDDHTFEALTDVVLISVFNPPCTGSEVHKEDGSYELITNNK
jgi:L-ectoine synthase